MMKILQLGKFYPIKGGVEKVMYDLTIGLSHKSITCDMLCASRNNAKKEQVIKLNDFSKIIIAPTWKEVAKTKISFKLISRLRKICTNYDIVHIHHPDPMVALALFLSRYKGKVILHWHSDILTQKKLLILFKPLQNWLLRRSDLVLTTTPTYLEESADLQKFKGKSKVLPIGIEDVSLLYSEEIAESILKKYKGKKIIFSLGRLVNYKGYRYLINAASFLPTDYVILIGGEGPLKKELQEMIVQCKLTSKVELLGYLTDDELYSYYKTCDLYCLSSIEKTEAFAIVQIEAMSYSKPIIATNIPESGVSWVNAHGFSGINVSIRDSKALADAFQYIVGTDEIYDKFVVGARNRYEEVFTLKTMIDSTINFYKLVLK